MTVYTQQCWGALVIFGLADPASPQSGKGVVFTNGQFALPAEIPTATYTIRAWLTELGGETFTANLRTPCAAGGGISAKVEDSLGLLSALLVRPGDGDFRLEDARLTPATTTIHLSGNSAPTVNQILWIEAEAVKVTVVVAGDTARTWTCTVTRGQCGSFAVSHHLTPSVYWTPNSEGTAERILVTTKPVPSRHRFFARAYRLRDAGSSTVVSHYRDGYLSRLLPKINPQEFDFSFEPVGKLLEEHEIRKGVAPASMSRCIEILSTKTSSASQGSRLYPYEANLWLTGKEASLLLDWPFRPCGSEGIDAASVTAARAVYVKSEHLIHLTTEAGDGSYVITGIEQTPPNLLNLDLQTEYLRVGLSHKKSTINLTDQETTPFIVVSTSGNYQTATSFTRYTGGFSEGSAVPIAEEGDAPTAELWCLPVLSVSEFFARILGSDKGDSGGTFDNSPPGVGIGLPESMINWGATAGTPSLDTLALAELNQLYPVVWTWPLKPGRKPADLLNGICRLLRFIVTPLAAGGMTMRPWDRPLTTSPTPIILEQTELTLLQDIKPLRALEFVKGIDLLTFEPVSKPRLATVQSTKAAERGDVERVWILHQNSPANPDSISFAEGGDVFGCCRAFFITLQGEPLVLSGMTDLDVSSYQTADYVTLTDDAVPTEAGRGVAAKRYFIISIGLSWLDSGQPVLMLPDELNNPILQSAGKIGPTLRVTELRTWMGAGPYTVTVRVESIGETAFNGSSAHGAIWTSIKDSAFGYVRVLRPVHNRVTTSSQDRKGWLECYAKIAAIRYVGPESELDLTLEDVWLHDGLTIEDYFLGGNLGEDIFMTLMDVNASNRLGVRVEPIFEQWYSNEDGLDFLKFDGVLPVDGHRSVIGA